MRAAEPAHRTILAVDIQAFGDHARTNRDRLELRRYLKRLVNDLLEQIGATAGHHAASDTGDGLLITVSPQVSSVRLLDPLVSRLSRRLATFNRGKPPSRQLRLRVAVHAGGVLADPTPHMGAAVIHACRLLDCPAVRACLEATDQPVAAIVSHALYHDVVKHAYRRIDPATWHPVVAHVKETREPAWVHVPGDHDAPRRAGVLARPQLPPGTGPIPRELPSDASVFTGRQDELGGLEELLVAAAPPGGAGAVAIDGIGGVGKSALAIHAAHRLARAGEFPDGQLYLNLNGATPGLMPVDPLAALGKFLRSLGLPGSAVPVELEEAAARYRSLLADRQLLVVLDNARSASQVRPLLPGSPSCRVVVTSRDTLALDCAVRLPLGVMSEPDAVELLGRLAGDDRVQAESDAATRLAHACGLLPLAIRITGRRLATRPRWTLASSVEQITGQRCLDHLRFGDQQVRSCFEVSYQALREEDADLARAFRLLALLDSPDVGVPAAAAMLDRPRENAGTSLERLVDAHLLEQPAPGRYRLHDLVRLFAREHADETDPPGDHAAALARVFNFYLATVCRTDRLLRPGWHRIDHDVREPGPHTGMVFSDQAAALAWLESERINLVKAVVQAAGLPVGAAGVAGDLAASLFAFFEVRGFWWNWEYVNRKALDAARRAKDDAAQAVALDDLGVVFRHQGRYEPARRSHQEALAVRRALGNRHDQARSLYNLGVAHRQQGQHTRALACHEEGLAILVDLGDRFGQARNLEGLGVTYERLGRYPEAVTCLQDALARYRELGDCYGQATSLNGLGVAHRREGHHTEALTCHDEALALQRHLGDRYGHAVTLRDLGLTLRAVGQEQQACERWEQALTLFAGLNAPEADEVYALLAAER